MKKLQPHIKFMNIELNMTDECNIGKIAGLCRALSSETRLHILKTIRNHETHALTISEIAKELNITVSAATFHLKLLEEADLLDISFLPNKKGKVQICRLKTSSLYLFFPATEYSDGIDKVTLSMPVGLYVDAKLNFISGFATKTTQIMFDENNYFTPERIEAEILWCRSGFVEYAFSNVFKKRRIKEMTFSLEICSETLGYRNNWKSDITFSLNNTELLTWTSPGDFGDRRGRLNPDWWDSDATQYGHLKKITVRNDGVYLDGNFINRNITLNQFNFSKCDKLLFRVENKDDAEYKGGFNIFGKSFGDFPQDIMLSVVLDK